MAANPATGKTASRHLRFLANGYDLSGDMRALNGFGVTAEETDATGWADDIKQYLSGAGDVTAGITALWSDTVTDTGPVAAGTHEVLNAADTTYVSVFVGIRSAPAIGNASGGGVFEQSAYTVSADMGPLMVDASYRTSGALAQSGTLWGVALATGTALTATGNGVSVDGLASSTGGWIAIIHLPQTTGAMASNDWAFKIEHSTDDSSFATLTTFTADGSAITAERKEGTGTVNRYVRLVSTRTAGTARPWVTFIRR